MVAFKFSSYHNWVKSYYFFKEHLWDVFQFFLRGRGFFVIRRTSGSDLCSWICRQQFLFLRSNPKLTGNIKRIRSVNLHLCSSLFSKKRANMIDIYFLDILVWWITKILTVDWSGLIRIDHHSNGFIPWGPVMVLGEESSLLWWSSDICSTATSRLIFVLLIKLSRHIAD